MRRSRSKALACTAAVGLAATALATAGPAQSASSPAASAPAAATVAGKSHKSADKPMKVMTLNLYLGGSLGKVIETIGEPDATLGDILQSANTLYDTAIATNFPKRSKWIAQTIKDANPDIITLNELTNWVTTGALPDYDYLEILQQSLKQRGMKFKVASLTQNADIGLDLNGAKSPVPYSGDYPGCEAGAEVPCTWRLQDRDAVLYNAKSKNLKLVKNSARDGSYKTQQVFEAEPLPGEKASVDFDRGWASAQFKWMGKKFTAMTSHFEVESTDDTGNPKQYKPKNWPSKVQVAQGNELLKIAKKESKKTNGRVILAGDLNTDANGWYSPTYANLTRNFFTDSWAQAGKKFGKAVGATCCQTGTLDSNKRLDSGDPVVPTRIDLVLNRKVEASSVEVLGKKKMENSQPKWQSDHYFYAAEVMLK